MSTLFNPVMQKEKIAAIGLVFIIIIALSGFIIVEYGDEIFSNITSKKNQIEYDDCVEVNFIGKYASNNSIFDSSYSDPENKTGATPLKIFVSLDIEECPYEEYSDYSQYLGQTIVKGFIEGLVGLKEGESKTIGPVPPEKAYGIKPQLGDQITIPAQEEGDQEIKIDVYKIHENQPMPEDYLLYFGPGNTTIYILRLNYSIGDKIEVYPAWENATIITKINESLAWHYTTPPEDSRENFTWVDSVSLSSFWEGASSIMSINESTIIVKHNPEIGATMDYIVDLYSVTTFTVVNLTEDIINVSYVDYEGNTSYSYFNRTITILRNQTQPILLEYPKEGFEQLLIYLGFLNPDLELSLDYRADKEVLFDVEIVKVHKISEE